MHNPNVATSKRVWTVAALLALGMLLTRTGHIGDALHLPDASMALFFLGGLYARRWLPFVALFALSVAIDAWAIGLAGVSAYCLTAAYAFMPLAYAVLWQGGRLCAQRQWPRWASFAAALGFASLSFLVSNGSFYWLGGRVPDASFAGWMANLWQWGPRFVAITLVYTGLVLATHEVIVRALGARVSRTAG